MLEAVVTEAVSLLGVDAAALAALEGDELVITAAVGDGAEQALGARSAATGWVAGDVVQSRAPVAYEDTALNEGLAESDALIALGHRAYLGVPLAGREGALHGVLSVYALEPRLWREDETQALAALAANASVALSNAELYQHVAVEREQSVAILANIADGIVAVDREGHVVLWNRAAEEITGVPAAEAIGRTPLQVLQRDLESEHGGTNRHIAIANGDREVWLSLSEAVMRDPAGAVAGRIFAFRDISSEHVVEQMKSDFVSTVSVELRAPLTTIYGFAQTLLREDIAFGDAERRTFTEFISRESERLTSIVDALLNVARLDTGDVIVSLVPTDVASVVTDGRDRGRPVGKRPSSRRRGRAGAARGAGGPGEAEAGARPARLERGQVLARRRRRQRVRAAAAGRRRGRRRRRGSRHPGVRAGADLREVLQGEWRAGHRSGALHRPGPRARDGRHDLGRLGGGTRVTVRVRASGRPG